MLWPSLASVTHRDLKDHVLRESLTKRVDGFLEGGRASSMVIEDEDKLLGVVWGAFLVNIGLVLVWQVLFHLLDATEWVRLVCRHEIEESNWLVEELMVLEPRFVKEPLLPSMVPRSQCGLTTSRRTLLQPIVELPLGLAQRRPSTFQQVQNSGELGVLGFLDI